jgi:multiple sugar transport system ATP-binding protein
MSHAVIDLVDSSRADRPVLNGSGDVSFDGVSKRFGDTVAVDELTLHVTTGELLVIVGPSGCGKTTALRMVAGLEQTSEGRVLIGGVDVTNVRGRDRDLAMVFQSYALYPHLTVADNIGFGLRQRRLPRHEIERRIAEVTEMLELGELLNRKPGQLSGGQRQRVALGRAIARQTDVLLMDEPLSNLDAQLRQRARLELAELHQRIGSTILYVTHDQVEAMTMGSRVAVMRAGVLQQCDTPRAIYEKPVNQFVASFIGSPPMNMIPVAVTRDGGACMLTAGSFRATIPITADLAIGSSKMVLGIRPEQFHASPASLGVGNIEGVVKIIEPLGSDQFVTIEVDATTRITARLRPDVQVIIGERIGLATSLYGSHIFDLDTQDRVWTIDRVVSEANPKGRSLVDPIDSYVN